MTPQRTTSTTRLRAFAASSVAALLLVTACGDDDDTTADTTSSTTEAVDDTTTTSAPDDPADDGDDAAHGDLSAMLPDVSAIDSSYTAVPSDDDDDSSDSAEIEDAMEEACPEAAALFEEDDEDDSVEQEYAGELERSITVGFDPTPRNLDEGTIDDAVAAISSCETVTLTQDGMDMTIDLAAERDDMFGDRGVLMTMNLSMSHPQLPAPIQLEMRGRIFQVGSLGAEVSITSGFDETTLEPVPGDFDLLDTLAAELETAAAEHEG